MSYPRTVRSKYREIDYNSVPHIFRGTTMTELHENMCEFLLNAVPEQLSYISSTDVQLHNVVAKADSMVWDFDLKNMWLTPSRWTMMVNQYLDPEELAAWLHRCSSAIGTGGRGQAVLRTKLVKSRGGSVNGSTNREARRWGSCMLAISYRATPKPQITLYSRTSYLGYIGALDLTVAWMCARYLAKAMKIKVDDISFVWMNESIQWHNFKSLAYMLNHTDDAMAKQYRRLLLLPEGKLRAEELERLSRTPALDLSRKWMQNLRQLDIDGKTYGDMNYNTYRRIRRRYHTEVLGYDKAQEFEGWSKYQRGPNVGEDKEFFPAYKPLPSTPVRRLSFTKWGVRLVDNQKGLCYDPELAARYDIVDDLEDLLDENNYWESGAF